MDYEITVTLRPMLYKYKPAEQYKMTKDMMETYFSDVKSTIIAELTQEHNVHYHCMVYIKDLKEKDKLLNRFRSNSKYFGRKSCQQVKYYDSYCKYLQKDIDMTRQIIGDPIIKDDYHVLKTIFEKWEHEGNKI